MYIGRKNELSALKERFELNNSNISVIYGRRRIGKTTLIEEAARGMVFYSFEGLEQGGIQEQKSAFLYQLKRYDCHIPSKVTERSTWLEIFGLLEQLISKSETTVILLDELQWLANYRQTIVSELKLIWDQTLSKHPTAKLVLCGSIASFIVDKVLRSRALYGRIDLSINLRELSLHEIADFFPEKSAEEIALAGLLVGGIPKYLILLADKSSVLQSFQFHAFRTLGYFATEYDRIFVSHFGKNPTYEHIIRFLSNRRYGASRKEIVEQLKLSNSGELTRLLENMEQASFISSFVPFDKKPSSRYRRYLLSDAYLKFFLQFLEPLIKNDELESIDFVRDLFHTPRVRSYLGERFEQLCLKEHSVIADLLGFKEVKYQVGPYFRHNKHGELDGVQIDLVFKRADLVYTACEIKYTDSPPALSDGKNFSAAINKIPDFENKTVQRVLITKTSPTSDLVGSGHFSRVITLTELLASA